MKAIEEELIGGTGRGDTIVFFVTFPGKENPSHTLNCLLTLSRSCSNVAALSMAWYLASKALSFSLRIFWYVF